MLAEPRTLSTHEQEIHKLLSATAWSLVRMGQILSLIQDTGSWRYKVSEDGDVPSTFGQYLALLAQQLGDRGHRLSVGNLQRLLSHYRLYVQRLGLSSEQMQMLGPGNLDEIRKMIDWDDRTRQVGPGENGKMGLAEATEYVHGVLKEAESGRIFGEAIRLDVAERLGRGPKKLFLVYHQEGERTTLVDLWIDAGPDGLIRPLEGMDEDTARWLGKHGKVIER